MDCEKTSLKSTGGKKHRKGGRKKKKENIGDKNRCEKSKWGTRI